MMDLKVEAKVEAPLPIGSDLEIP